MFNGKSTCSIPSIAVQREEYMFHSPLQLLKGKAGCYMPPWQLFKWKGNYSLPPQQFKGKSGCYISSTVVQWEEYIFHPLAVQRESWLFNPTPSCSKGRMAVPPPCYTAAIQKEEWLFHTHPETVNVLEDFWHQKLLPQRSSAWKGRRVHHVCNMTDVLVLCSLVHSYVFLL